MFSRMFTLLAALAVVDIYSSFTDNGSGITFNWPPSIVTTLDSSPQGFDLDFDFAADDGGYFFVDGNLEASLPGSHSLERKTPTVALSAGWHTFEIQYDNNECCNAETALTLPTGAKMAAPAPEASTWTLFVLGFAGVGYVANRRPRLRST